MVLITTLQLIYTAGVSYDPVKSLPESFFQATIESKLLNITVITLIVSIFIALFHILNYQKGHIIYLLITFLISSSVLFAVFITSGPETAISEYKKNAPPAGEILIFSNKGFFSFNSNNSEYNQIVISDPNKDPVLNYYDTGKFNANDNSISLNKNHDTIYPDKDTNPYSMIFSKPLFIRFIANDFQNIISTLKTMPKGKTTVNAMFLLFSLTFFCVSCWLLVIVTRWRFFNFLLVILAGRFMFFLFGLIEQPPVKSFLKTIIYDKYISYVPSFFLFIIGILFSIIALLLPPNFKGKRAASHE